ncbi:hypothetical protein ATO11_13840 [Pseudaestuariivita atlantica]|uniref:C-type lysozyme inhibitor domain-containing protein n=2 Tax=Pseudaestuariivita atlantica TaxID=1317121 RepID=A0A0L1JMM4_9RHOB|nr:hypothetical protein ATO11_13840 [Pseudaestuariivita atlantica]
MVLFAHAASAAMQCRFTTECYEAESCTEASFDVTLDTETNSISTEFGDFRMARVAAKDGSWFQAWGIDHTQKLFYLILAEGSDARMTLHMAGPQMVSYVGTCEERE